MVPHSTCLGSGFEKPSMQHSPMSADTGCEYGEMLIDRVVIQ